MGEIALCSTDAVSTPVLDGHFRVALDASCPTAVSANPDAFVEVVVDGTTSLGRSKLGAVPFAVETKHAVTATSAATATAALAAVGGLDQRISALESLQSGKLAGMWFASPGGCVSIQSSSWTNVNQTVVSFSVSAPVPVWATYSINVQLDSAPASEFVALRLAIDGTAADISATHYQPFSIGDSKMNLVGHYMGDMTAGAHTVQMQWATNAGGTHIRSNCAGPGPGTWTLGGGDTASIAARTLVVLAYLHVVAR
jgi:hypothetical protein